MSTKRRNFVQNGMPAAMNNKCYPRKTFWLMLRKRNSNILTGMLFPVSNANNPTGISPATGGITFPTVPVSMRNLFAEVPSVT